ncbi:unnamed protein product [Hyaloperonospora brassicae]|uniref:RxLR effector candidate protein n=1 Tax=Hyaloperonospora brassicae TaxID=162125 RepID=A0AAV0UQY9_HYABA|nr:unnamed protein product [Hyaloperonospora brassicae]
MSQRLLALVLVLALSAPAAGNSTRVNDAEWGLRPPVGASDKRVIRVNDVGRATAGEERGYSEIGVEIKEGITRSKFERLTEAIVEFLKKIKNSELFVNWEKWRTAVKERIDGKIAELLKKIDAHRDKKRLAAAKKMLEPKSLVANLFERGITPSILYSALNLDEELKQAVKGPYGEPLQEKIDFHDEYKSFYKQAQNQPQGSLWSRVVSYLRSLV